MLGAAVFGLLLAAAAGVLLYAARASGMLLPVAAGGILRLAVMLGAHALSVHNGDGGYMYLDDRRYMGVGDALANSWLAGDFVHPESLGKAAIFGYDALLASIFVLTGTSVVAAKLANVLLGTATVYVTGRVAARLLGAEAGTKAAWLVAVAPTLVWWSAPVLKDALVAFLFVTALFFATGLATSRAFVSLAAAIALLAVSRVTPAIGLVVGLFAAVTVAALRHRKAIEWRPLLARAGLAGAGVVAVVLLLARSTPSTLLAKHEVIFDDAVRLYRDSELTLTPLDVARTFIAPYPWVFDETSEFWVRTLYPGMWFWYVLFPTIAVGAWRLRRLPELWLLATPVVTLAVVYGVTIGVGWRQRSTIEPILLIFAAAGFDSLQRVALRGSVALAVVGIAAAVHSRSAPTAALVFLAAIAAGAAARRLPAWPAEATPASPLTANLVRGSPPV